MSRWGPKVRGVPVRLTLLLLLLAGATTGCSYEDLDEPLPSSASTATDVLAAEMRNYAVLEWLLGEPTGPVILEDSGPLDGPGRGFGKGTNVEASGQFTVTAACVGASGARMFVTQQDSQTGSRFYEISVDCFKGVHTQAIELQPGYVSAHLLLPGPGDTPWTGAVGGLRVSASSSAGAGRS